MLTVLYFASIREALGVDRESVALPSDASVEALVEVLRARGGAYAEVLAASKRWRVAVNQELALLTAPLNDGDEVAIFPPVTGG
jgi:molybdopterin synthase sulfur carrier subunit